MELSPILCNKNFLQIHLIGCMAINKVLIHRVYPSYPKHKEQPNVISKFMMLCYWQGPLPKILYVQLDNIGREK